MHIYLLNYFTKHKQIWFVGELDNWPKILPVKTKHKAKRNVQIKMQRETYQIFWHILVNFHYFFKSVTPNLPSPVRSPSNLLLQNKQYARNWSIYAIERVFTVYCTKRLRRAVNKQIYALNLSVHNQISHAWNFAYHETLSRLWNANFYLV